MDPQSSYASLFRVLSGAELPTGDQGPNWLLPGYLARGSLTLLIGAAKGGKTTFLSVLLKRLEAGGALAGMQVRPGKALVITEESAAQWQLRHAKFNYGSNVGFLCRPFLGKPEPAEWLALIEYLLQYRSREGLDLAVIDTLASFLPGRDESNAGLMMEALMPLQRLTSAGMGVLLSHHPRKQASLEGQWSRGSTALTGAVDILMEMHYMSRPSEADRRRKLLGFSRFDETPRCLVAELNAEGTDYARLEHIVEEDDEQLGDHWPVLQAVLAVGLLKETREEIMYRWPEDEVKPSPSTLWRCLDRTVSLGLVLRDGDDRARTQPHRYWLKGQEEFWKTDPLRSAERQAATERPAS